MIRDLLLEFECQPILFVGSGLSQRYFGAPTWTDLLRRVFSAIPDLKESFEYIAQKHNGQMIDVGTYLSDIVFEWAWSKGKPNFPEDLYRDHVHKDVFLEFFICRIISEITINPDDIAGKLKDEINALGEIRPHAIITTNYDTFLETVFDGYEPITGQTILKYNTNSFGEIFHIHGDVTDPKSIVVTKNDYDDWSKKKKYVSAKLLTYFAEHPIFIFGYGLGDPNIKSILCDIGEIVADKDGLIPNVCQIIWHGDTLPKSPPEQAVISVDGREFRIMAVHTNDLEWVFRALRSRSALTSINPKLVRALAARTMRLIRHDIPSGNVKVDYDVLERVAADTSELPKLLGITSVENPNQNFPFTLTQVAQRLGFNNWQEANKLLNKMKEEKGIDIRSSDNRYHCKIKTGNKNSSITRKWSHEAIDLLRRVAAAQPYEVVL